MSSSRTNTTTTNSNNNNGRQRHQHQNRHHHRGGRNRNRNHRSNTDNNSNAVVQDYSQDWLESIAQATQCLQNHSSTMDDLNASLNYLTALEAQLLVKERRWHLPPNMLPPTMGQNNGSNGLNNPHPSQYQPNPSNTTHINGPPSTIVATPGLSTTTKTSNRYALFQAEDDDDDDDNDDETTMADTDMDEAGDQITFQPQTIDNATTKKTKEPYISGMDMRRIMIRIYNAQSDVFAAQALICRKQYPHPEWVKGANMYSHCLHKIHSALVLADSEISKWMSYTYNTNAGNRRHDNYPSMYTNKIIQLLTEDAEIVEIAVQSIMSNREQYISAAKQLEGRLLRKLAPQWRTRDEVKEKMGIERWTNNQNPKNDFSNMRLELENELNDIRKAIKYLLSPELDTTNIEIESKQLRERIQMGEHQEPSNGVDPQQQEELYHHQQQRYNGIRPIDYSRRVDIQLYPDPTIYGWMFTGSYGVTEFFEKYFDNSDEVVKLDWYYTTATVKTSMHHPVQGYTQLFAARVDPDTYLEILQDPRAHTGQRYKQRRHRRR